MSERKIGVVGCAGRMGVALMNQIFVTDGCAISGGTEKPGSNTIGQDAGEVAGVPTLGLKISADPSTLISNSDVILDFTAPAATAAHAAFCAQHGTAHIIGTTGLKPEHDAAISTAAQKTVIVQAGNMSVGVNLLVQLTQKLATALDTDWDIEILEMHHRYKIDSPSGTALMLGQAAARGRGVDHDEVAIRGRDGISSERQRGDIGYASLRGGNVVGEHTVLFAADNERIELTHKAADRSLFARGAVTAALWSQGKIPGHYNMADVLGF